MNVSLYQAAAGMKATSRWQEVIAENLSSSSIPGYKRQNLSFNAVEAGVMAGSSTTVAGGNRHYAMPSGSVGTDFQAGELKPSGGPADVAIDGRGFFEVQLPSGGKAYTRDGEFHVNSRGELVTKQGYPVSGAAGTIQLDPSHAQPISISAQGEVSQGSATRGSLQVYDFADYRSLQGIGGGYFIANDPLVQPRPVPAVSVHHGYLESANTSSIREMADLLSSVRLFEANQKVIQTQDERLGRLIAELGNPA